jgi:1-acyl-sn-glycerol-3-phosphate acyltransferase
VGAWVCAGEPMVPPARLSPQSPKLPYPHTPAPAPFLRPLARLIAHALLRLAVSGADQVPLSGGLLLTMNHLGGADPVLALGFCPRAALTTGKVELLSWPLVVRAYGMIPLRRDGLDVDALRRLLAALEAGQALLIAPEGRESRTGALEAGQAGAAFLAQKANVPIVPVALTGTAWKEILPAWRRIRRPCVTLTYGPPYRLPAGLPRAAALNEIMRHIADLLPPQYRGVYADGAGQGSAAS